MEEYKTDLDQLHKVVTGQVYGRRQGKTTARIHELASIIELGNVPEIIIVISAHRDMDYLRPMIENIFRERKLPGLLRYRKRSGLVGICGNTLLSFVITDKWGELPYEEMMGRPDCPIVFIRHGD